MIRYVEINDKKEWYDLDRHLPENVFDSVVIHYIKSGYTNRCSISDVCYSGKKRRI